MGQLSRARRIRDDDRERANAEIRRIVNGISDRELAKLFDFPHGDVKSVPPPEALGLSWPLLWRALGRPRALAPEDGSMAPDCTHEEAKDVERRMVRVIQPLRTRLEVIDSRNTRRNRPPPPPYVAAVPFRRPRSYQPRRGEGPQDA